MFLILYQSYLFTSYSLFSDMTIYSVARVVYNPLIPSSNCLSWLCVATLNK